MTRSLMSSWSLFIQFGKKIILLVTGSLQTIFLYNIKWILLLFEFPNKKDFPIFNDISDNYSQSIITFIMGSIAAKSTKQSFVALLLSLPPKGQRIIKQSVPIFKHIIKHIINYFKHTVKPRFTAEFGGKEISAVNRGSR